MARFALQFKEVDLTALVTAVGIAIPAIIAAFLGLLNRIGQIRAEKDRAVMQTKLDENTEMTRDVHQAVNGHDEHDKTS